MNILQIYEIFKKCPLVVTDTRKCEKNSIFFALKGDNFDGNSFIKEALDKGCAYAIGDDPSLPPDPRIIQVKDVLATLQNLATHHRKEMGIPVIAITGTNGKTTTKELTASVLSTQYNVIFTQGNLNNHIGVPLTLLKINSGHQIAIIEMGANHPGEIKLLSEIALPDYGVITNIGKAHLEGFGSFEGVIRTKGELYNFIRDNGGKIFINHENKYLNTIATDIDKIYYGTEKNTGICGKTVSGSPYLSFEWHTNEDAQIHPVSTRLIGEYNLENALAAITIGTHFNISAYNICHALESYVPQNNRSQLKETDNNHLIIDAYNANPTSMLAALENFRKMDVSPKAIILGDMKELGESSKEEHQKIIDFIENNNFDAVFLCGNIFSEVNEKFPCFKDNLMLSEHLKANPLQNYYILIKGSRSIQLEKLIDLL